MTVQAFYDMVNGQYEDVLGRLLTEQRIRKYLLKLPSTGDFDGAVQACADENWADLFRFTHNIKGISLNLGLAPLAAAASDVCEMVRHGAPASSPDAAMQKLKQTYGLVCDAIGLID